MSVNDIIRAWKDPIYRAHLNLKKSAKLPINPAGSVEIADEDLKFAAGGYSTDTNPTCSPSCTTNFCCCGTNSGNPCTC